MSESYTCSLCRETFTKGRSAEAEAEPRELMCDGCAQRIYDAKAAADALVWIDKAVMVTIADMIEAGDTDFDPVMLRHLRSKGLIMYGQAETEFTPLGADVVRYLRATEPALA